MISEFVVPTKFNDQLSSELCVWPMYTLPSRAIHNGLAERAGACVIALIPPESFGYLLVNLTGCASMFTQQTRSSPCKVPFELRLDHREHTEAR